MEKINGLWNKEYRFSSKNESKLQSLCEQLEKDNLHTNIWLPLLSKLKRQDEMPKTNPSFPFATLISRESNEIEEHGNMEKSIQESHAPVLKCTVAKENPLLPCQGKKKNKPSLKHVLSEEDNEINMNKKLKIDEYDKTELHEKDNDIKAQVATLRETLVALNSQLQPGYLSQEEVAVFHKVPPHQIVEICQDLKLSELSELSLATLCNAICALSPPLSFTTSVHIVQQSIYLQVAKIKSLISRVLSTAIVNFSKQHPKIITEGLIVPCIENRNFGTSSMEILTKVIKEDIPHDYLPYITTRILQVSGNYLEEPLIAILTITVDRKVTLGTECVELLTKMLCTMASKFSQNLKFSKLMLNILTIYGAEMGELQLSAIAEVIKMNRTFLKKAAEMMLKKLKS